MSYDERRSVRHDTTLLLLTIMAIGKEQKQDQGLYQSNGTKGPAMKQSMPKYGRHGYTWAPRCGCMATLRCLCSAMQCTGNEASRGRPEPAQYWRVEIHSDSPVEVRRRVSRCIYSLSNSKSISWITARSTNLSNACSKPPFPLCQSSNNAGNTTDTPIYGGRDTRRLGCCCVNACRCSTPTNVSPT